VSTRGKLARLERAAGVGVPCLDCNHHSILYSDLIARTRPDDLLTVDCPACGFPRSAVLAGFTERERELLREYMTVGRRGRTLAERRRWFALQIYVLILPGARAVREVGEAEEERLRAVERPDASTRWQVKVLDEYRAREDIKESIRRKKRTPEEEERRESLRAVSAPTMAVIKAVRERELARGSEPDMPAYWLRLMAGLEPLIFGYVLPETEARLAAREAELRAEEERRERERREAEERRERERLEREERYRLMREEREREGRERRERERPAASPATVARSRTPALDSEFWDTEPAPEGPVKIPEIPAYDPRSQEADVSRLADHVKYRAPRWEGDTDY